MLRKPIEWALNSPLIVLSLAAVLAAFGTYAFVHINVEAYPDPAPPLVEVIAQYPGASAEEVERQVTIPLEVALAGMPGLQTTRTKSLAGLSHLRNQFEYGMDYAKVRQEVINRLQTAQQQMPPNVTPVISANNPIGELIRYTLSTPRDPLGRSIYTLNDLKALQDWTLTRQFRRVPRIIDVVSFGGEVKRYEVHPDPDLLKKYSISLQQVQNAIANSNGNVGGDMLVQGPIVKNVRGVGLLGGGLDPMQQVLGLEQKERDALAGNTALSEDQLQRLAVRRATEKAGAYLRSEEKRRLRDIRRSVITSVNNVPVRVEDVVEGGAAASPGQEPSPEGVVVGHQTRLGKVSISRPRKDAQGNPLTDATGTVIWDDEEDKIQGIVLMRKGEQTLPALHSLKEEIAELNNKPGEMLPGVKIDIHFDQTGLIERTTTTVRENLLTGMFLVTVILLMFLSNVRSAVIVAINIPLALLFALSIMFLRGKSANLLSIGAVDFGIIVDSSVIMVENIYRHVNSDASAGQTLKQRILSAAAEVDRSLLFSTGIMLCAFIPLFAMQGAEGQIFGPMADTYAFALGGALLLALLLSPVLCLLCFRNLKPARDNFIVRGLKAFYLWQLKLCLNFRWVALGVCVVLLLGTLFALSFLGREFMPVLEEGNVYIRATCPVNISLEEAADRARTARAIIRSYPEVELVASSIGRPDDGTDPSSFYNVEFSVPLKPEDQWKPVKPQAGWRRWFGSMRPRTKAELVADMNEELDSKLIGIDWSFSQYIRDNVVEAMSGVKGDNSVKIFGPSLDELEKLAEQVKARLEKIDGIKEVSVFHIQGQSNLEFGIDREKANQWGVSTADVQNVIKTAVGGQPFTQITEGEKSFDLTLRWPDRLRSSEEAILNIPVDLSNNQVTPGSVPGMPATPLTGPVTGISPTGTSSTMPALMGSVYAGTVNNISAAPRRRLRDLVVPLNDLGMPDPDGHFNRPGASTISREQGKRFIAVKFSVRDRDLAGAVAEAQEATQDLFTAPYHADWSGEFQQMEAAEKRLVLLVGLSLVLIFLLLYFALHSVLDALVVCSNVAAMSLGGIWALLLSGTNFNISAGVGFVSILGVAVMNGLLLVSAFNAARAHGTALGDSLLGGMEKLIRPVAMTALAAIFGFLPAAFSTRIGSESQKPLALVVVGGMIATLLLTNLVPVLYSFYGDRQPSASAGRMAH